MKAFAKLKSATLALLKQGTAPAPLAACIALSVVIGLIPILGVPTPLLTVVALALRWNLPIAQLANYLVTPLQLLLIVPCIRIGESLLRAPPLVLSPADILALLRADPVQFLRDFSTAAIHAILGWAVIGLPVFVILFFAIRPLLQRAARRRTREA